MNVGASLLSLISNLPGALFRLGNEFLEKRIDKATIILCQMSIMSIILIIASLVVEGTSLDTSDNGIFGFLRPENWFIGILMCSICGGFWVYSGYVISMFYFSPLALMNTLLIEPITSQVAGVFLEIDEWPGALTWIGVVVVGVAINVIHKGSENKEKEGEKSIEL